jgi:PhnB protein
MRTARYRTMQGSTTETTMTETKPSPIPDGPRLAPHLVVRDATRAIEFYVSAFGATETMRLAEPSGKIGHAELTLAGARIMLADEYPEYGCVGPDADAKTSFVVHVYVEDVDALAARAVAAGAVLTRPIANEFYGDRVAQMRDPFGHRWSFASRVEIVSTEEMQRRFAAMIG